MNSESGGSIKVILIGLIVVVIAAVLIIGGVSLLSQPPLPAAQPTPTPIASILPTVAPTVVPTSTPTPTATISPSPSTVPTNGGVSDGVITNICGEDPSVDGVGNAEGQCGKCENLGGTDGYCQPESGEEVVVIGCTTKTGTKCNLDTIDGGEEIERVESGRVYVSDYLDDACTIQLGVTSAGGAATTFASLTDYIVFQEDNCNGTTGGTGGTPAPSPTPATGNTSETCGESCFDDLDCVVGEVCSTDNLCVLEVCEDDPTKCITGNKCELTTTQTPTPSSTPGVTTPTPTTVQCGATCATDSECPANHLCSANGVCQATACVGSTPDSRCVTGCLPAGSITDDPTQSQCGGTCQTSADCTSGNSCSNGKCVADFCLTAGAECTDGCSLPKTALISDEVDRYLIGITLLIMGILAVSTNAHVQLFYALGGRNITAGFSKEEREVLEKERAEQAKSEHKSRVSRAKKTRERFEKAFD